MEEATVTTGQVAAGRRVAVVTGGSAGLGRAIVREFADRGWDVGILARGEQGLQGAVSDVERVGGRAIGVPTDVADRAAVEAAADRVERELGPIDAWVNDAMVGVFGEFMDTDPDDFERAVHVDFFGFVNGTRAALSRMTPRDRGSIVQVGSALAHRGIPLQAAYCSSKHAIKGFTESVLTELLHDQSNVTLSEVDMPAMNTVQFNWVKSKLPKHAQPVPPIYQPEICAKVVVDVAERPRRRTWVGESTVMTIVGNRLATRVADWYLARTGYSGQQADEADLPTLRPNLYKPSDEGDQGAHGAFDHRSMDITPQTWGIRHRSFVYSAAAAASVLLTVGLAGLARKAER